MMKTVSLGRCNFLAPFQLSLICTSDYFILPTGRLNFPTVDRLSVIRNLIGKTSAERIIVGNPYEELEKLNLLHPGELMLVTTQYNARLGDALSIPVEVIPEPDVTESTILDWLSRESWSMLNTFIPRKSWIEDLARIYAEYCI